MAVTVAVVFAIGMVVPLAVGGEICQRKTVMGGQQVDAGQGTTTIVLKNIAGAT